MPNRLTIVPILSTLQYFFILLLGGSLCSFQTPEATPASLPQQILQAQANNQPDSAAVYYQRYISILQQQENNAALLTAQQDYFLYQLQLTNDTLALVNLQLESYPQYGTTPESQNKATIRSWKNAYRILQAAAQNRTDSVPYFITQLQQSPIDTMALLWGYTWAINAQLNGTANFATIEQYIQNQTNYLSTQEVAAIHAAQAAAYTQIHLPERAIKSYHLYLLALQKKATLNKRAFSQAHYDLALVYIQLYNTKKATLHLQQALQSLEGNEQNNQTLVANIYATWASICIDYQTVQSPLNVLRKGISTVGEAENPAQGTALQQLYLLASQKHLQKQQLDSTIIYLSQAQQLQIQFELVAAPLQLTQLDYYIQTKKIENTAVIIEQMRPNLATYTQAEEAQFWHLVAVHQFDQKQYKKALQSIEKSIWKSSSQNLPKNTALALATYPDPASYWAKDHVLELLTLKVRIALQLYQQSQYNYSLQTIYETTQYSIALLEQLQQELPQENKLQNFIVNTPVLLEQALDACWLMYERYHKQDYLRTALAIVAQHQSWNNQRWLKINQATDIPLLLLEKERYLQYQISALQQAIIATDDNQIWLKSQLKNRQKEWQQLQTQLTSLYPKYYETKYQSNRISLDSLQGSLGDSTALVSYFEGKKAIYQFIITTDTLLTKKIIWRTYRATLQQYYDFLTDTLTNDLKRFQQFARLSHELYHKVLHDPAIAKSSRLVFIMDGKLQQIPFETLLTELPESMAVTAYQNLPYLMTRKRISYDYSLYQWQQHQTIGTKEEPRILGFAPTFGTENIPENRLAALYHARQGIAAQPEATTLFSSLQEQYEGKYYTQKDASEYYFKKYVPRYDVLHLALPNLWINEANFGASLVLAEDGNEQEDNILSISEIKQLPLQAQFLLLPNLSNSATTNGSSLALGRAFMYAGTPALLTSIWQPKKESANLLLQLFYAELKKGLPKDEALRQAKLQYLKTADATLQHPVYWATFVQWGSTASVPIQEPIVHIWWFVIPLALVGGLGWWSLQALRQR